MYNNQILQTRNIKRTPVRETILSIFLNAKKPLSVQDIESHDTIRKLKSDKTTIYRTIDTFYHSGIIQRLEFQEGKFRYELIRNHHHHVVCTSCGNIQDISECFDKKKKEQIEKETGFTIHHHSIEFFGICAHCKTA
ncbi:MAG: transcriptional repressor [Patescibacteria group bacterium]|nr:transcriptional repressor [Patescibacteria group bacterium]